MGGLTGQLVSGAIQVGIGFAVGGPVGGALALVSVGLSIGLSQMQGGKQKSTPFGSQFEQRARDRSITVRSSVTPRRVIVGESPIGGTLVYATSTGSSNKYAHVVVIFCDGSRDGTEVEGVPYLYFDNIKIDTSAVDANNDLTTTKYAGKVRIKLHLGAEDQVADQDLIDAIAGTASAGEWTANHRLQGIVYAYLRFTWDEDVFVSGQIPEIGAIVRGDKSIVNTRTQVAGWSRNPIDVLAWYVQDDTIGLKGPAGTIRDSLAIAAANVCEEQVALAPGGTQDRYTCDGVIYYGEDKPVDILEDLLTACAGTMTFSEGAYNLYAAEYRTPDPLVAIDEDAAREDITWDRFQERRQTVNRVRTKGIDPTRDYALSESFEFRDPVAEAEDGLPLPLEIELPFTMDFETGTHRQQRICKIILNKRRKGSLIWPGNMQCRGVAIAEPIEVTVAKLNMLGEVFLPLTYALYPAAAGGVDLELAPESPSDYAWNPSEAYDVDGPGEPAEPDNPPGVVDNLFAQQSGPDNVTITWSELDPRPFGYDIGYGPEGGRPEDAIVFDDKQRGTQVYTAEIPPGRWTIYIWAVDEYQVRSPQASSTLVVVQNFNDIVREEKVDPAWIGQSDGWVKWWDGVLVPAQDRIASALTVREMFEEYVPYPVAQSSITFIGAQEVDLGFDAAGVRVFPELVAELGPGETEGGVAPRVDLDYRLSSGFYTGWKHNWTVGIIDFRYLIHRIVNDNTTGRIKVVAYTLVMDVQESAVRDVPASVGVGPTWVEFPQRFHNPPSIGIGSVEPVGGAPAFIIWDPDDVTETGFTCRGVLADGTEVATNFVYSAVGALGRSVV